MKHRLSSFNIGSIVVIVILFIVIASVFYTNVLVEQLKQEEQQRVQIWADAFEHFYRADENTTPESLDFYFSIIQANNTIPVYLLDEKGDTITTRNVTHPVDDPRTLNGPIEIRFSDEGSEYVYYVYYDESRNLTHLKIFPYIEFGIILLFIIVAIITLITAQRGEQNRVWAGLSKETAHQLGTPISSLIAWQELLQTRYPQDELIPEIKIDIQRLSTIADRFSKVGSEPVLIATDFLPIVRQTVEYVRTRISNKVSIELDTHSIDKAYAKLCAPLFSWVLENLLKNALDAMEGKGTICIRVVREGNDLCVDITDSGRGIDRGLFHTIFQPGYTSKKRGWGLGLSLSKRIIEDYHGGKIFVKNSEIGVGTTFRIVLKEAKNS